MHVNFLGIGLHLQSVISLPSERAFTTKAIEVPSWIRGYHAYKEFWSIEIDEILELKHEYDNKQDKNAIAVIRNEEVVGHIPRALANTKGGAGIVHHFLTKIGSKEDVKVIGKALNRSGGFGMEVPCIYQFTGQERSVDMLSKLLDIANNLSVRVERSFVQIGTTEKVGRIKKQKKLKCCYIITTLIKNEERFEVNLKGKSELGTTWV